MARSGRRPAQAWRAARAWHALRRAWPHLLLLAALALLARDGWRLAQAQRFNAAIEAAARDAGPVPHAAAPMLQFARAHGAAAAGRAQEALTLYQAATRDPRLAAAAHYNAGNVHLREALALAREGTLAKNPHAAELAKSALRDALRTDPALWPARYNLERALWLAPEGDEDDAPRLPPEKAERAATTMRGFTLGLP
jgi:mxaK protein